MNSTTLADAIRDLLKTEADPDVKAWLAALLAGDTSKT
jgi:hypothetical protein